MSNWVLLKKKSVSLSFTLLVELAGNFPSQYFFNKKYDFLKIKTFHRNMAVLLTLFNFPSGNSGQNISFQAISALKCVCLSCCGILGVLCPSPRRTTSSTIHWRPIWMNFYSASWKFLQCIKGDIVQPWSLAHRRELRA